MGDLPEEALVETVTELSAESWSTWLPFSQYIRLGLMYLGSGKLSSLQGVRHVPELSVQYSSHQPHRSIENQ